MLDRLAIELADKTMIEALCNTFDWVSVDNSSLSQYEKLVKN